MLNIKNFNLLIDRVRKLEHAPVDRLESFDKTHFSMRRYHYSCGAPACMAGHGHDLFASDDDTTTIPWVITGQALGIDEDWGHSHLFNPTLPQPFSKITPERACRALERVRDAGDYYMDLTITQIWRD